MAGLFVVVDINAVNVDCGEWITTRQVREMLVKMDTTVAGPPKVFLKIGIKYSFVNGSLHEGWGEMIDPHWMRVVIRLKQMGSNQPYCDGNILGSRWLFGLMLSRESLTTEQRLFATVT